MKRSPSLATGTARAASSCSSRRVKQQRRRSARCRRSRHRRDNARRRASTSRSICVRGVVHAGRHVPAARARRARVTSETERAQHVRRTADSARSNSRRARHATFSAASEAGSSRTGRPSSGSRFSNGDRLRLQEVQRAATFRASPCAARHSRYARNRRRGRCAYAHGQRRKLAGARRGPSAAADGRRAGAAKPGSNARRRRRGICAWIWTVSPVLYMRAMRQHRRRPAQRGVGDDQRRLRRDRRTLPQAAASRAQRPVTGSCACDAGAAPIASSAQPAPAVDNFHSPPRSLRSFAQYSSRFLISRSKPRSGGL